jgi:hypothetical protein
VRVCVTSHFKVAVIIFNCDYNFVNAMHIHCITPPLYTSAIKRSPIILVQAL